MSKREVMRMMLLCLVALLLPGMVYANTTTVTISGGEQHAANGNWDSGSLKLTVDGHSETVIFGQFSSVQSVASGLAAKFSQDCNSPVKAHASGAVITFQTNLLDVSFEQISASPMWDTSDFAQSSFDIAQGHPGPSVPTPSLALACTPDPIPAGGSADCTASLPKGATGTVNFAIDSQAVWSTADVDGDGWAPATTLSGLQPGSHTVTASYSGDSHYNSTTQTLALPMDSGALVSTTAYSYTITPTGGTSGYAANGNILSYTDTVNGGWTMNSSGYDGLNRLVGATYTPVGSSTSQYWCWAYDSFGNRLSEATSSSSFGGTCPTNGTGVSGHQYSTSNQISGDSLIQYDSGGNTISDHSNQYLYDGDGRVCAVNNGLIMTQYIYDADGIRVAKGLITSWSCDTTPDANGNPSNGFQATASYVLGPNGEQVTEMNVNSGQQSWAHTNVYAGGMLVATYDPLGLHFHLDDWLGNRRVQTNAFGQIEETCLNSPFGNGLVCSSPNGAPTTADDATEHHFTGKERDTESGLDYFGARYYASNFGRWMSPDWSAKAEPVPYAKLDNPQSLNLYNYVGGNPLSKADADGRDFWDKLVNLARGNGFHDTPKPQAPAPPTPQQSIQQNNPDAVPAHMTIASHEPKDANSTNWHYNLTNSKGSTLKNDGYGAEEHITPTSRTGAFQDIPISTSEGSFVPIHNGSVVDNVGLGSAPDSGSNGESIVRQTFTIDFQGIKFDLSTVFQHDTVITNGQVTKTDVSVVKP